MTAVAMDKSQRGNSALPLCIRASSDTNSKELCSHESNGHTTVDVKILQYLNTYIQLSMFFNCEFIIGILHHNYRILEVPEFSTRIDWQLTSRPKCS